MLEIRHLDKTYANGVPALRDVSFNVAAGEIVALVGGSGCGKSTLLRLLSGLDTPTAGSIAVDGQQIREPHAAVGIVFQEPRLVPWLTVAGNVGFGLSELPRRERDNRVVHAVELVGLSAYSKRWPRELSGGQSQRVAIARALVTRPTVLLMDEPFSALDAFTRVELQDHVLELWQHTRTTLVLVTHDIEEAVALASRIIVIKPFPGHIAAQFDIHLPRPRDRLSHAFEEEKRRVLLALDKSLSRSEAPVRPTPELQPPKPRSNLRAIS